MNTGRRSTSCRPVFRSMLVLGSVLTGCVAYTPRPLQPTAEIKQLLERGKSVPAEAQTLSEAQSTAFPLSATIDSNDGLSLAEANTLALFYSPELIAARAETGIAAAQLLGAGLLANPDLFVGPRFANDGGKLILPVSLSLEIPLPGELSAAIKQGKARSESAKWTLAAKELEVLLSVQERFILLGVAVSKSAQLERLRNVSSEVLKWVDAIYAAGDIDSLTYHLSRVNHADTESRLEEQIAEKEKQRLELFSLLGIAPEAAVEIHLPPMYPSFEPLSEQEINERISAMPSVRAAASAYEETEAALKAEVLRQYPRFRFGPEFESDNGQTSIGFGLGIKLPLFNRTRGPIREAEERRQAAHANYQAALLELLQSRKRAQLERSTVEKLLETLRKTGLPAAEAAENALRARLSGGITNVLEVTTAQRALADAKAREAELEGRARTSALRLAAASGAVFPRDNKNQSDGASDE